MYPISVSVFSWIQIWIQIELFWTFTIVTGLLSAPNVFLAVRVAASEYVYCWNWLICFLAELRHSGPSDVTNHIPHNWWFEWQTGFSWHNIFGKATSFPSRRNLRETHFSEAFILFQPDPGFWSNGGKQARMLRYTLDDARGGGTLAVRIVYKEDECQREN